MEKNTSYGKRAWQTTAREVAELVGGKVIGESSREILGVAAIEESLKHALTYLDANVYHTHILTTCPRTVIVHDDFQVDPLYNQTLIKVPNVAFAWQKVALHVQVLHSVPTETPFSQKAQIHPSARIGEGTRIGDFVAIGPGVHIGRDCDIRAGVKILADVRIGNHCVIYENAVIGGEGFGFIHTGEAYVRRPHLGSVVIEDYVEVGHNTCIDRGVLKHTIIKKGVKLDNLIHIAHGAEIGEHVAIAAQSGISGSSSIGANSRIGGQVGVIGHIKVAPGSQIQAQSGVAGEIKESGKKWYGYPAIEYYQYLRSFAIFKKLPELLERLRKLERKDS